ncbi:MAG: DUF935 family protein [Planctomycetia bacterium]|nr:MAG: DUF935 family protein [Planctomycetia bacterium]
MNAALLQPIRSALSALGSLLGRSASSDAQRVIRPWREDALRGMHSGALTPSRVLARLGAADAGRPEAQFELFDEMLRKWTRLAAVAATRRLALTALDWDITPAAAAAGASASAPDPQRVADHCRDVLRELGRFDEALDHLAGAVGYGVAVAELVWEDARLVDVVPAPFGRLVVDEREPWRLRLRTQEFPHDGVALDEQPGKWIVHTPGAARMGRWFDGGLLRTSALLFLAQSLSFKDWLTYSQIAGMPLRIAQFEPGTPASEKEELLRALSALGTDAAAAFSKAIDLRLMEASGASGKPYEAIQRHCNTEVTILWLGQHLTTELPGSGSRAAAEVHDRVREDLLADDIAEERRTLRRDLLTPLVRARFGPAAAVPHFARSLSQSASTRELAEVLSIASERLKLRIPREWAHRALGIPEAGPEDALL